MFSHPIQKKAYDTVSAAVPFAIDPAKITVEPGVSYLPSPIKLHDYAVGVMAAFGSVVEHLGRVRGLPSQTMTLNRRLSGFHLNELQTQFLNGYSVMLDTWPMGADNGTYRTKDERYVQMIGLFPHMVNALTAISSARTTLRRSRQRSKSTPRSNSRTRSPMVSTSRWAWCVPRRNGWPTRRELQPPSCPCSASTSRAPPRSACWATPSIARWKAYGWST